MENPIQVINDFEGTFDSITANNGVIDITFKKDGIPSQPSGDVTQHTMTVSINATDDDVSIVSD